VRGSVIAATVPIVSGSDRNCPDGFCARVDRQRGDVRTVEVDFVAGDGLASHCNANGTSRPARAVKRYHPAAAGQPLSLRANRAVRIVPLVTVSVTVLAAAAPRASNHYRYGDVHSSSMSRTSLPSKARFLKQASGGIVAFARIGRAEPAEHLSEPRRYPFASCPLATLYALCDELCQAFLD
jgi:hypothetical protein